MHVGSVGRTRGIPISGIDPEDRELVANVFGIAEAMVAEIVFMNDEWSPLESPEDRWQSMRAWADRNLNESISARR